jgi:hypothetical protein
MNTVGLPATPEHTLGEGDLRMKNVSLKLNLLLLAAGLALFASSALGAREKAIRLSQYP